MSFDLTDVTEEMTMPQSLATAARCDDGGDAVLDSTMILGFARHDDGGDGWTTLDAM